MVVCIWLARALDKFSNLEHLNTYIVYQLATGFWKLVQLEVQFCATLE